MGSVLVYDRPRSPSRPPPSVDETPAGHVHLKEGSSIPSVVRVDSFVVTRLESSKGLADRITKVSSVPALLVSVSIKSFDYVLFHVPRKVLDDIAADLGIDPVDTYRLSLDQEDLVLTQLTPK